MNAASRLAATGLAAAVATALAIPALTAAASTAAAASKPGGAAAAGAAASNASRHVLAWGYNAFGQLGDGTTTGSDVPVKVQLPPGVKITQARAGCLHTLAITSTGQVLAWGANTDGQLGNGTTTGSDTPVRVSLQHGTKVTAVRAGCEFSLALTTNGHVLAWGANPDGQLGDGTTSPSDTPVRVSLPSGTRVTGISAGDSFSLARTSKGHALAWGNNGDGQLGDGTTTNRDIPVKVRLPRRAKVKALAAGGGQSLASTSGGGLFSWGANDDGQLGDGSTTDSDRPVRLSFPVRGHVTSLFAGCEHSLALLSSGTLLAWGDDQFGQLGDDGGTSKETPVKVLLPADTKIRAVSAGCTDSYALTAKGHVLAWGYNIVGQLGDGSTMSSTIPVRVELPSGWRASVIGTGPRAAHVLAIMHRR
jgi:alpha-tubulin suppressor-like RCC1 family protein